jgi:trigger factor
MDFITTFSVEPQPASQVKISGEIPFSELEQERGKAIAHLGKDLKVDGFRPGHVPDKVIIERIGEMALLGEMAERAIARVYPRAVKELNIDAIGYPAITITKIAPQNPLGFTATVSVLPTVTLPDYKKIIADVTLEETVSVTDADVEETITNIMRQHAAYERLQQKASVDHTHTHDEDTHDHHDHDHDHTPATETESSETPLPELNDEYVKKLGQFENVDDFKAKIREHLTRERTDAATAARRAKITDAVVNATEIDLPEVLVTAELDQMSAQMKEELERAHLQFADYLNHIKKTEEELRNEWRPQAEHRAKLQLILNTIATTASVPVDASKVSEQVAVLKERFPDADTERVRVYVHSVLQNEAVMQHLEALTQ